MSSLSPLFGWRAWTVILLFIVGGLLGWIGVALFVRERRKEQQVRPKNPFGIEARYRVVSWRLWTIWTPWRVLWAFAVRVVRDAFLHELRKNAGKDAQYRPVDFDRRRDDKPPPEYPKWK